MGAEGGGRYAMTTRVSLLQYIRQYAAKKEKGEDERFLDECFTILVNLVKDSLVSLFLSCHSPPLSSLKILSNTKMQNNRPQAPQQQQSPLSHQQPSQKTQLLSYFLASVHFLSSSTFDCLQPPSSEVVPSLLKVCRDVVVTHSTNLAFSKAVVKVGKKKFNSKKLIWLILSFHKGYLWINSVCERRNETKSTAVIHDFVVSSLSPCSSMCSRGVNHIGFFIWT